MSIESKYSEFISKLTDRELSELAKIDQTQLIKRKLLSRTNIETIEQCSFEMNGPLSSSFCSFIIKNDYPEVYDKLSDPNFVAFIKNNSESEIKNNLYRWGKPLQEELSDMMSTGLYSDFLVLINSGLSESYSKISKDKYREWRNKPKEESSSFAFP